jgi:2-methylisocitrate lyase-like PEP mutase family enzyme
MASCVKLEGVVSPTDFRKLLARTNLVVFISEDGQTQVSTSLIKGLEGVDVRMGSQPTTQFLAALRRHTTRSRLWLR